MYVEPSQRLGRNEEKRVYDQHENSPDDAGYRRFLSRLAEPLCRYLPTPAHGLDFGCGPGPTLSVMLQEKGYTMDVFDPIYYPALRWQTHCYDFITATEVIEHVFDPAAVLPALCQSVRPGGVLALMTKRVQDRDRFAAWHYKNDPTHVCFYSVSTFDWLAKHLSARCQIVADDVVFFFKQEL